MKPIFGVLLVATLAALLGFSGRNSGTGNGSGSTALTGATTGSTTGLTTGGTGATTGGTTGGLPPGNSPWNGLMRIVRVEEWKSQIAYNISGGTTQTLSNMHVARMILQVAGPPTSPPGYTTVTVSGVPTAIPWTLDNYSYTIGALSPGQEGVVVSGGPATPAATHIPTSWSSTPIPGNFNTSPGVSVALSAYVYDPKSTTYTGTGGTGDAWKGTIAPANPATYCGTFLYDTQGRCTNVWKLQSTTSTPWTYVQTQTTYPTYDGTPEWGQAQNVVEDYGGTGHINRTTTNNAYTSWGKPCSVTDAAGHTFTTVYWDNDGNVKTVSTPTQTLVTYAYGNSGITNGDPTDITDGLTGVTQHISYQGSGNGVGNVSEVDQGGGANPNYQVGGSYTGYSTLYSYSPAGDRMNATYQTANGVISWQYRTQ